MALLLSFPWAGGFLNAAPCLAQSPAAERGIVQAPPAQKRSTTGTGSSTTDDSPPVAFLVSTSTTSSTIPPFLTTTTLVGGGVDVTGGARVQGGFGAGGYDLYIFEITGPVVLVAETSDGSDHCPGDTTMELSHDDVAIGFDDESGPGHCSRIVQRLVEPGSYSLRVTGYLNEAVRNYTLDVEFVETDCGNYVVELLEECDDGNSFDGDCCSAQCQKAPDATPCDNGLLCDGDDTCANGQCSQHTLNPCPGANGDNNCAESCSDVAPGCTGPDPDGSPCSNGLFCDGDDRCVQGTCSVHAGDPCRGPDGDGHCAESCKESTDSCSGQDPNFSVCDDGAFCNGTDACSGAACVLHSGNPCPGADGDANCAESCSEGADHCRAADPKGSACDDGLFCTGADQCAAGTCSTHAGSGCPGADGDGNCAESCDEIGKSCSATDPDGAPCNDGVFCNGSDTCSGGSCSVHAGNPCPGPDNDGNCRESCSEQNQNCAGHDPNSSPCTDGLFCNGTDTCTSGLCALHTGNPCPGADADANCSESCSEASDNCTLPDPNGAGCNDGLFCNGTDTCAAGACSTHVGNPCAGADGDGNCAESCNETADNCTASDANGTPCDDGVFCNGADTCSGGTCSVHAGNPCPGADGDGNCSESCNETADACTAADPDAAVCNDGAYCNGSDTCSGGTCSVHAGNPCPGADGDNNCSESCNEAADLCTAADPVGSTCSDGLFCNGNDTCSGGICSVHTGDPCSGADGDDNCSESCNEAADACTAADPGGSACNDNVYCNGVDTCSNGLCSLHAGNPCPGADGDGNCSEACNEATDACTAADPNDSACNDNLFCNGNDTCSGGTCSVHNGDPCPGADGDGNCSEACNESKKACTAPDPDVSSCDDGLLCNGDDSCLAGFCVVHTGNPCVGADGDGDCAESCSDSQGGCTGNDPAGSPCDDGLFCNGADTCSGGACSVHAGNPCAGADGDSNCLESCEEVSDTCSAADANGSACDDGLFCNGADTCSGGACTVHAGNPCPGADGDGNCSESCNEASDVCSAPDPDGVACNDALFCNGADTCNSGICSAHAGSPCPGADGDGNCSESCNETADNCSAADPQGALCQDGLFCNGDDACVGGTCGLHNGDPCPGSDGDSNCSESCNESADSCNAADPQGSACEDGVFCNGDDTCSGGSCSAHADAPCSGPDSDGNCAESCDEAGRSCTAADPNGSFCDDNQFCNGSDTCTGGKCTGHAGDPCQGADGDRDCSETCNETFDACSAPDPSGSPCLDSEPCTIGETCDGAGLCSAGTPIDCTDEDPCTADVCQDAEPHCLHSAIPNCPPNEATCGDANGNGGLTAADALIVLRAAVGGDSCDGQTCVCDVNGNGAVTAADALAVLRAAVGADQILACQC